MKVNLIALTMVDYFRDVNKQVVLLFINNVFRFVQAGSEVSAYPWEVVRKNNLKLYKMQIFFSSNLLNSKYYYSSISLLPFHIYNTLGANETILVKSDFHNSRATGPKTRVPFGFPS